MTVERLRQFILPAVILLTCLAPSRVFAQIQIRSHMDWSTGILKIEASRPLEEGPSPSNHPMALAALERDFVSLAADEIGRLVLDNTGTLNQQKSTDGALRSRIETLAREMERQWSRISGDFKLIEASYLVNLRNALPELVEVNQYPKPADIPIGWVPTPQDDWTGIVIFVPNQLPLRGTGLVSNPVPALRARLLSGSLQVLLDPASSGGSYLSYRTLDNRESAERLVGRRPYLVMARELYGKTPCDIIISDEDARRLLASASGRDSLSQGRAVILVEELPE